MTLELGDGLARAGRRPSICKTATLLGAHVLLLAAGGEAGDR